MMFSDVEEMLHLFHFLKDLSTKKSFVSNSSRMTVIKIKESLKETGYYFNLTSTFKFINLSIYPFNKLRHTSL